MGEAVDQHPRRHLATERIMSVPFEKDEHPATISLAMRATSRSVLRSIRGFARRKHRFPFRSRASLTTFAILGEARERSALRSRSR